MELYQNDLFQTGTGSRKKTWSGHPADTNAIHEIIEPDSMKTTASIDGHMTALLSDYLTRLPDNATRKHIARQLINFIIKSANL